MPSENLRALNYRELDPKLPLLESILPTNDQYGRRTLMILGLGKKKIAMLGLSFKVDSDDLRESLRCNW